MQDRTSKGLTAAAAQICYTHTGVFHNQRFTSSQSLFKVLERRGDVLVRSARSQIKALVFKHLMDSPQAYLMYTTRSKPSMFLSS